MKKSFVVIGLLLVVLFIGCGDRENPARPGGASAAPDDSGDTLVLNIPAKYHSLIREYAAKLQAADSLPDCIPCDDVPDVEPDDPADPPSEPPVGDIVYVTPSGKKFHKQDCRHATNGQPISRAEAIEKGYTACKSCNP